MVVSTAERELGIFLRDLPRDYNHRYTDAVDQELRRRLFLSLAANDDKHLRLLFPSGPPAQDSTWKLRDAQGAVDGAEYTEAARGHPCGHIFKAGESTYHCKTCAADETCVLCAKCFAESDHDGHLVYISVSPGNSGCCDCADDEAWIRPVHCTIHSATDSSATQNKGKKSQPSALPEDLLQVVRMTIGKAFDYLCDVFSCSPEQLRLPKTEESVRSDELLSRLTSDLYGGPEVTESDEEYALILWNDEKHTVDDVQNQVAKACGKSKSFGLEKAKDVDDVGRSVIYYSSDINKLLNMAACLEQIKISVTVRSARDTFREQMCSTIVDWISDISGCSYGSDPLLLRQIVCQELLRPWRMGSEATNHAIGEKGLDDHEHEDNVRERRAIAARWFRPMMPMNGNLNVITVDILPGDDDDDDEDDDDDADDDYDDYDEEEAVIIEEQIDETMDDGDEQEPMDVDVDGGHVVVLPDNDMDLDIDTEGPGEIFEATHAGYPPPPAPGTIVRRARDTTSNESDESDARPSRSTAPYSRLPKTPKHKVRTPRPLGPAKYWLEVPDEYKIREARSPEEDLWQRVRLDYLILYDLRLWKTLRVQLRHLYISTVVTVPQFKRILGLRFAGLYTMLAQLYLIADREPDHSIINLSVQMLTTPSITAEVVERGNFLTNLLAILYTFLTTRQVGFPSDVNPNATLAFEAGAVTNRRMFHFFVDTRYMFQSTFVQEKIRHEQRYLLQFLDLVKLHQGICPNVRAVGEHVEYEADAWISASVIIKEINRLCRQVAESFKTSEHPDLVPVQRAIRHTAHATFINAFGYERNRFTGAEIKTAERFQRVEQKRRPRQNENGGEEMLVAGSYSLPQFDVAKRAMSFHHPLHYLLSWLLEAGKAMTRTEMLRVLHFDDADQKDPWLPNRKPAATSGPLDCDEVVSVLFEHPLRVCTWLAQMRAGMWVRNGVTLRHQMVQYRGTSQRDVSFQRDILLLQAGLVLCGNEDESLGERFLAQMVNRFCLDTWINGMYGDDFLPEGYDHQQRLDVAEEFYHLLIVLLSERHNLLPDSDSDEARVQNIQRDIAHVLCFKPLSFSDISSRLTDRVADSEDFDGILENMTDFKSPEGLNDSGTFELHPEYIELVDPYYAYYNRNQREEAENIYKQHVAKMTGKPAADIVYEPKLRSIESGLFSHLSAFTQTALFHDVIYYGLGFALRPADQDKIEVTKVETLLHVVLHLALIAVLEDTPPNGPRPVLAEDSFVRMAIHVQQAGGAWDITLLGHLFRLLDNQDFASCAPKIRLILDKMSEKWPAEFAAAKAAMAPSPERPSSESSSVANAEAKELKKRQALERQAKVMASFKAQQNSFLANQGLDWDDGDVFSDMDEPVEGSTHAVPEDKTWEFPTGSCMLCQEETNDRQLYGTFAFMGPSRIFRQTPINDPDFVEEVLHTPSSLDRSAEAIRPFGVAGSGNDIGQKASSGGSIQAQHRHGLSKGFPKHQTTEGPVVTSCGHLMHFSCFEAYVAATRRRHAVQIARNHPERMFSKEFLCPLCKALGNTFLPLVYKDKHYSFPGMLGKADQRSDFDNWLRHTGPWEMLELSQMRAVHQSWTQAHLDYLSSTLHPTLASTLRQTLQSSSGREHADVMATDDFVTRDPPISVPPREWSRAALPELVQRAAIELGLAPEAVNLQPRESIEVPLSTVDELRSSLARIEEGMRPNQVVAPEAPNLVSGTLMAGVQTCEAIATALAYTISSTEIAQRGVEPVEGIVNTTLLDAVPEQTMTTLKILSETLTLLMANKASRSDATARVHRSWSNQLRHLLGGSKNNDTSFPTHSLLENDMFVFFASCSANEVPMGTEMHHVLRLCYSAELIKVLLAYHGRDTLAQQKIDPTQQRWTPSIETSVASFQQWVKQRHGHAGETDVKGPTCVCHQEASGNMIFCDNDSCPYQYLHWPCVGLKAEPQEGWLCPRCRELQSNQIVPRLTDQMHVRVNVEHSTTWSDIPLNADAAAVMERLVDKYALTFLRKALILLHVRFGIDFSAAGTTTPIDPSLPELARLSHLLQLPLPSEIFAQLAAPTSTGETFRRLAAKWTMTASWDVASTGPPFRVLMPLAQSLSHPAIFELVGLPKNYDTLTEEAIKRRCPTTGRDITDPALCLFCGEIFCSQAGCCIREKSKGGCWQHRAGCGGPVGAFISIRKCMVLLLHHGHGSWFHAPYLDKHGEVDPTLRRHHQLFLNQKRYDRLVRDTWLGHGIHTMISRRLEGDMNTGGWETF